MKKFVCFLFVVFLTLTISACASQEIVRMPSDDSCGAGKDSNNLIIDMNGTKVKATLYDNKAARSFKKLLPYSVTVYRSEDDLCGSVSEELETNPEEDLDTWSIGEIGWFDGWFTILCDNEEGMRKRTRTIIGRINEEDLAIVQSMRGIVYMTITLEEAKVELEATNILVAYFSRTGTTEPLAEYAAEYLNADLFEIEASVPYTDADIAYYTDCRADREQNDKSSRPAIAGKVNDMDQYDVILLGYPIWHGQAPRIIDTFLESYDFSGKTIVPFCTSHSSGIGNSDTYLHGLVSGNVTWKAGKRFPAGTTRETMVKWLSDLGIEPYAGEVGKFDFEKGQVLLNSGYSMPINGIGTYSLLGDTCVSSVKEALRVGVRLIDTAYMYHNEREVGQAIREAMEEYGIKREEIFVITKLYPGAQFHNPETAIEEALEKLDIGYIDMMLLHHPGTDDVKAYLAMEKYVKEGIIRSLGLSNWYIQELNSFLPQVHIKPALVQNEIHPYYQESEVVDYIHNLGIVVQGWYPLGGRGYTSELLGNEIIKAIAEAHGVSSAQVILRWNLQNGVVVIPGSSNPSHILENTQLYHFELTEKEMDAIRALNRNEKHDWY